MRVDNQSTIYLANDEKGANRTKHIDVRAKWLTQEVAEKNVSVSHVKSAEQRADMLTKALGPIKFDKNRAWLVALLAALTIIDLVSALSFSLLNQDEKFVQAELVHYKMNPMPVFSGLQAYQSKVVITNPCGDYFSNTTKRKTTNS